MRRVVLVSLLIGVSIVGLALVAKRDRPIKDLVAALPGKASAYTVEKRVDQYGKAVALRMAPAFAAAGVVYPPHEIAYVTFKDQRLLQVYARNSNTAPWRHVTQYQVLAASGKPGPKLKEGDSQVPEGIYEAESLNPNSRFHLSIRLNYPNIFDRRMAKGDERTRLGGDIMIHGNQVSIGCLAMGDQAAEDLFIMAAQVGKEHTRIVVSPTDFRAGNPAPTRQVPAWTAELYDALRLELKQYPRQFKQAT
ncbi:MAG: L,D-transpeptidase family protein [Pseudomonadota bacterium]